MSRFLLSFVLFVTGFLIMKYSYNIMQFLGRIEWAESKLGGGGTFTLYKFFGLFLIIIAILHLFNALPLILSPLSKIFGG